MVSSKKRGGFSLIELVIVVLVIGIIAAVAAPKLFNVTSDARTNGTRQSLTTIRNAIELYRANTGIYPVGSGLQSAIQGSLQGDIFPAPQIGAQANNNTVRTFSNAAFAPGGAFGWAYNEGTGQFYLNDSAGTTW